MMRRPLLPGRFAATGKATSPNLASRAFARECGLASSVNQAHTLPLPLSVPEFASAATRMVWYVAAGTLAFSLPSTCAVTSAVFSAVVHRNV